MQPGLHDVTGCRCLQLSVKPSRTCKHGWVLVFRIPCPKSRFLHFLNLPLGLERVHLQELSRAEPRWFVPSKLFAQRLNALLPILSFYLCYFSAVRGASAGCRTGVTFKSGRAHVYTASRAFSLTSFLTIRRYYCSSGWQQPLRLAQSSLQTRLLSLFSLGWLLPCLRESDVSAN